MLNIAILFFMMTVTPYKDKHLTKKQQVEQMFDNISPKYDFLNHFLSLGIDIAWRKKAIKLLSEVSPTTILDIATGTGDFAIESLKLDPKEVIGVDISEGMLEKGREKIRNKKYDGIISLRKGDSEALSFEDNYFDGVIVAFGVRNFENLEKGLSEMLRVTREGGKIVILEFSKPGIFPFKQLYNFYFKAILPLVGRSISSDSSAYTYLPESVQQFPDGEDFTNVLVKLGYRQVQCKPLTFGISSIYTGIK